MYKQATQRQQAKLVRDVQLKSDHSFDTLDEGELLTILTKRCGDLNRMIQSLPKDSKSRPELIKQMQSYEKQLVEIKPRKVKINYWYTFAMILKEHNAELFGKIEGLAHKRHGELDRKSVV